MLEQYLEKKLYEAAQRENMDLNDPEVFEMISQKRTRVMADLTLMIDQVTEKCGCGKKKLIKPEMETA